MLNGWVRYSPNSPQNRFGTLFAPQVIPRNKWRVIPPRCRRGLANWQSCNSIAVKVRDSLCAQPSVRGKGILSARTDAANATAISATRNQSQIIQRRTSSISSASLFTIFPEPAPEYGWRRQGSADVNAFFRPKLQIMQLGVKTILL